MFGKSQKSTEVLKAKKKKEEKKDESKKKLTTKRYLLNIIVLTFGFQFCLTLFEF